MFEKVPPARHTLIERGDRVDFTIPSRKNLFVSAFLSFWLCGWAFGEISVVSVLFLGHAKAGAFLFRHVGAPPVLPGPASWFMIFWLGAWTVGGGWAIYCWLWLIAGREIISASRTSVSLKRDVFGLGRTREYDATEVKNVRLSPPSTYPYQSFARISYGSSDGRIAFDYGARTFRFGSGIDDAEAGQIIERIRQALPARDH